MYNNFTDFIYDFVDLNLLSIYLLYICDVSLYTVGMEYELKHGIGS